MGPLSFLKASRQRSLILTRTRASLPAKLLDFRARCKKCDPPHVDGDMAVGSSSAGRGAGTTGCAGNTRALAFPIHGA